ncbi:hypothetical protein GCM10009795_039980 [Nocardioides hankookensis]|uniref:Tail assembly chaperone n=1 Tax=Nocardioides hankookensis TaxID=443157 RepID=A0ABW1LQL1_9ACTN
MDIVYTPEGTEPADATRIPWRPGRIRNRDTVVLERLTGMTFVEFVDAIDNGSMLALEALLFVELSKTNPTLKRDQVDFCMDEISWELDDEGKVELRDKLAAREADLTDVERTTLEDMRAAVGREPNKGDDQGDDATEVDAPKE